MELSAIQVQLFLNRLQLNVQPEVNYGGLIQLQQAYLLQIPFENLDIHLGKKISLDLPSAFEKIVERERGGYCYESNVLFKALLDTLGFDCQFISARMARPGGHFAPEFGHIAILVKLNGDQILVDVGNGQSCRMPLVLGRTEQFRFEGITYFLEARDSDWALMHYSGQAKPEPRFVFTTESRVLTEFKEMSEFHQTSAESPFTHNPLVTMALSDGGRLTLLGHELTLKSSSGFAEKAALTINQIDEVLQHKFKLSLSEAEILKIFSN